VPVYCRFFMMFQLLILLVVNVHGAPLFASEVDMVRVEDGKYSRDIIFQHFDTEWSAEINLTENSRTDDFTPVTIRDDQNRALVLWKESIGVDASQLRYRTVQFNPNGEPVEAGKIQTIKTETTHQSSPTLFKDQNGIIWGVWVGFNGTDDDIYYSRLIDGAWDDEKRIYEQNNDVPDLGPWVRLNITDRIEIRWRQFDFGRGAYVDVFSVATVSPDGQEIIWTSPADYVLNPLENAPTIPDDFVMPAHVTTPDSVALYSSDWPQHALHWNRLRPNAGSGGLD